MIYFRKYRIPPQTIIAVAVAVIVQGVTIISSPGLIFSAPTAQINPDVHEFTEIAYFTLKYF